MSADQHLCSGPGSSSLAASNYSEYLQLKAERNGLREAIVLEEAKVVDILAKRDELVAELKREEEELKREVMERGEVIERQKTEIERQKTELERHNTEIERNKTKIAELKREKLDSCVSEEDVKQMEDHFKSVELNSQTSTQAEAPELEQKAVAREEETEGQARQLPTTTGLQEKVGEEKLEGQTRQLPTTTGLLEKVNERAKKLTAAELFELEQKTDWSSEEAIKYLEKRKENNNKKRARYDDLRRFHDEVEADITSARGRRE